MHQDPAIQHQATGLWGTCGLSNEIQFCKQCFDVLVCLFKPEDNDIGRLFLAFNKNYVLTGLTWQKKALITNIQRWREKGFL